MAEAAPEAERRVLVRVEAYDDGTGVLEVSPGVSDDDVASYLLHLAGVAERGEHHQEHVEAPSGG